MNHRTCDSSRVAHAVCRECTPEEQPGRESEWLSNRAAPSLTLEPLAHHLAQQCVLGPES
eukprot:11133993-Alexandrium_andersonii.AAC.1